MAWRGTMQTEINPLIRDVYRRMREALGIEQAFLAKKIHCTISKLSKWEQDEGDLKDAQVKQLGDELRKLAGQREKRYAELFGSIDPALQIFTPAIFRELRELHGLSQSELANRAGLLQFSVSMFETGHRILGKHEAERAVNALKAVIGEREKEIQK